MKKIIVMLCLLGLLLGCASQQTKKDAKWFGRQILDAIDTYSVTSGLPID